MTFFLEEQTRDDIAAEAPPPPSFGERFRAAATMQRVEDDSWGRAHNFGNDLATQLIEVLPEDLRARMDRPYGPYEMPVHRRAELFEVLTEAKTRDPEKYGRLPDGQGEFPIPTTAEEFDAIVNARRQAEYDEQLKILSAAPEGSWGAEFTGRAWASLTEEKSLIGLMIGAPARVGVLGTMAIEGALGGAQEALMIPQRQQVAGELDVPQPNALTDIAAATILSGAFAGVLKGGARFLEYRAARGRATAEGAGGELSPAQQEGAVETVRRRLEENLPPDPAAERVAKTGTEPRLADFNFSLTGNASPRTNRVGYVYGKLLEAEIPPHIAAGIVGNGMVESGVGLHVGAVGDGGNAFGIWQWNGPRKRALEDFAAKAGKPAGDIDTQIAFLLHEMRTSEAGAWSKVRAARTAEEAAQLFSDHFERPGIPHLGRRIGHARDVYQQFQDGRIPRWTGKTPPPETDAPLFSTSRGYTGDGQVTAGNIRAEVKYEVVDASLLRRASGDLQPRDRSRAASDEQVAEIAARLDPARLMPSPEADRGAPVVGPDGVIESGNGRVMAIERAYARHPDRAAAYRSEIEAAGYEIPDGVKEPVLIARRTSDFGPETRRAFVREANNATVARMSPTERAAADAAGLSDRALSLYTPGARLGGPENRPFTQAALATLPQAERASMVDASGALNAEGVRRLQAALFARAWDAPDIIARFAEADAGELRGLLDALADAAPAWAALKADIAAGRVRADMDITGFVLDAMRMIAAARELAATEGKTVAGILDELLADVDLLEGAVSPLTAALVGKFWRGGRAAPKDEVAAFLTRYADEARQVGTTEAGLFGDGPGAAAVLRAIDDKAFADLPDEIGQARTAAAPLLADPQNQLEAAFARGADSPEAVEGDAAAIEEMRAAGADGPFGPVFAELDGDPEAAIAKLKSERRGEVPAAVVRDGIGEIALVWGTDRFGLMHILDRRPELEARIPELLRSGEWHPDPDGLKRAFLVSAEDPAHVAVIRLDWDGVDKNWLVTSYRDDWGKFARDQREAYRTGLTDARDPASSGQVKDSPSDAANQAPDLAAEIAAARADAVDLTFRLDADGPEFSAAELLDDVEADEELAEVLKLCNIGGAA